MGRYNRNSPGAFVRWYHPDMAQEATSGAGRKKKILDLFGVWRLAEDIGTLLAFIAWCLDGVSSCSNSPDVLNVMTL